MQDLAVMVSQQGESLDNIEISINDAKHFTESASKNLTEAKTLHQAARKVRGAHSFDNI